MHINYNNEEAVHPYIRAQPQQIGFTTKKDGNVTPTNRRGENDKQRGASAESAEEEEQQ